MEVAWIALALSLASLGWQVYTWYQGRRFDVRLRVEHEMIEPGSGKYPITVVVENLGSTIEAVQELAVIYPERFTQRDQRYGIMLPPAIRISDIADPEVRPRRNYRHTFDLLASGFRTPIPDHVTATAVLESGETITSEPYEINSRALALAQGQGTVQAWPAPPQQ